MKKRITTSLFLMFLGSFVFAQTETSPWSFEFGVNAVDVYPIGESAPYGEYMDEFFNLNDHWNLGGFFIGATRDLSKHISISARGTSNELSKWGEVYGDESVLVDNLKYYSLDGMVNFKFTTTRLQPYIAVGGGYTWIEEGLYNTFSLAGGDDNLVGAGTVNGAVGAQYQLSDHFALNLQFMYKHVFEDYLTKHMQHSLGVVYSVGNKSKKDDAPVLQDTDSDGIPDLYDACPNLAGTKEFGGCPDSDGDGIPDNYDDCPNVKGTDGNGCPPATTAPTEVIKEVTPVPTSEVIYFEYDSAEITNNAKTVLNGLAKALKTNNAYQLQIGGHADSVGSENYNATLSSKRAESVKSYLVSQGLSADNISTTGFGETQSTANNSTKEGRALNRRSELEIKVNY